jgi:general stress protein 26
MEYKQLLGVLERLIDQGHIAVLATADGSGQPGVRWMSPALVRGRPGFLYAVTSPKFAKAAQLEQNNRVAWMVQTRALDEVVTVTGTMNVIANPALHAEVLEAIGRNLGVFWRLNDDPSELVVLETIVEEITYLRPTTGEHHSARGEA